MAATNQVTKIYELRSLGADTVLADIQAVNQALIEVANTKQLLARQRLSVGDPAELAKIDTQLAALVKRHEELVKQARSFESVRKEQQISNSKAIKDNEALAGSYDQLKAKYQELQAIANKTVNLSNPQEVAAANAELAKLKITLDEYDASRKQAVVTAKEEAAALTQVATAQGEVSTAIAAGLQFEQQRAATVLTEEEAQAALNAQYEATKAEVAEIQAITAELNAVKATENAETTESVLLYNQQITALTGLSEQLVVIGGELGAVTAAQKANFTAFQAGKITYAEYETEAIRLTEKQTLLRNELGQVRINANATAKQMLANVDSMKSLGLQVGILKEQYRNLTAAERESAEGQALLAQIQAMDAEIKVLDATLGNHTRNVGNYAGVLGNASGVAGKFLSIVERMGLRMIAMVIVFEAITKAVEFFSQRLKENSQGITDYDRNLAESAKELDEWNQRKEKQNQLLQAEFKDSPVGSFAQGSIDEAERQLKLLQAQQETGRNALRDKEASKKIDKEIFDQQQKITRLKLEQVDADQQILSKHQADALANKSGNKTVNLAAIDEQQIALLKKRNDLQNELQVNELNFQKEQKDKYDPFKTTTPKNFAKQEEAGLKELAEVRAHIRDQQIEQDIQANEQIFQDDKQSLAARLLAYENYASDKQYQAEVLRDKQKAEAVEEAAAVEKLLNDGKKKTQEQINSLVAQREAAHLKLQGAEEQYQATIGEIDRKSATDQQAIINSDIAVRLKAIDDLKNQAAQHAGDSEAALATARQQGLISEKKFREEQKVLADKEHIYELELIREYLVAQILAYNGSIEGLKQLQSKLDEIEGQIGKAQGKLGTDQAKIANDLEGFYKKLKDAALDASKTIADGYIAEKQKQIDKNLQLQETQLDTEKQARLNAATSAREKAAIEKEYDQKKEALERAAFERNKKLAEAQLAIDFVVASGKAAVAAVGAGPAWLLSFAENEALVALQYAAQLAVLENQHYGQGGDLKKVLGGGGIFSGPSHTGGGIRFSFGGLPREVEGREGFVVAADSMANSNVYTVTGTPAQIASAANVTGGGVNFAPGASFFGYGGSLGSNLTAPYFAPASSGSNSAIMAMLGMVQQLAQNQAATNYRIDTLRVELNPHAVTNSQDRRKKLIKMTTL